MVMEAVKEANSRFSDAYRRGDLAAVAAAYTEDAALLPPNSQMIKGRQGIREFWSEIREAGVRELTLDTVSAEQCGDTAYEVGAYALRIEPEGAQSTTDRGKYVVVWKRQADGAWKLAVDIWNTSLPPA